MIKSISYDQTEIIKNILALHVKSDRFDLDPTYSKGNFYNKSKIEKPMLKFDLYPQTEDTRKSDACDLPLAERSILSIMFDPPFLAGYTKKKPTGIIGERFNGFPYIKDLWTWYDKCLTEHYRILDKSGILVFKCQDTVSSGKQHISHVEIINKAVEKGFYCKDIFILLAKNRMIGHNHKIQQHARKFHSYFLVFKKL
jgi:hypothetical protein